MNDFPWPLEKPDVRPHVDGWNGDENLSLFKQHLGPSTRVIVELGVWLGQSTLEFLRLAPESTVVCVDHWLGSEEHQTHAACSAELPTLRETFLANVWEYRSRVVVISDKTTAGLKIINDHRISPDFIYVDASHRFEDVKADVEMADHLFPNAILAGDDFDWEDVRRALESCATQRKLYRGRRCWWFEQTGPER
jgi:predicted O-methyltransferase YrrM